MLDNLSHPYILCTTVRRFFLQVEKAFLQNEGGCRDGVKRIPTGKMLQLNKNHTPIPMSFFL